MKQTVLVVREFDKFSKLLREQGFNVINLPLIQTLPIEDFSELEAKFDHLESYDGLFFTSPKAAEIFLARFPKNNFSYQGKVYVLGQRAKTVFENSGFEIIFREKANTAEELINSFAEKEFRDKKYLFVQGDQSLQTIPDQLKKTAEIDGAVVYRTIKKTIDEQIFKQIARKFRQKEIDWVCFFSPAGIESFVASFGRKRLNEVSLAVIGSTTAKKAVEVNSKVDFIASTAKAENFAAELIEHLKNR
jgi:uroporphyrinogen III methyltransferase / synthase